jgi:hypothetical protein
VTVPDAAPSPQGPPAPLTVAASLVAVEALVFVILGVAELAALESQKAVMGATTSLFFLAYGAGLAACAWAVWRCRSWGRAPIVVAQLIQVLLAWSFWGGETTWVAVGLGVVAAIVLAGIMHPESIAALADEPGDR